MASLLTESARETLARQIRLEMAKQGLTRVTLAEKAGVKERTLGNLLAAHAVRDQTVARITKALGIELGQALGQDNGQADGHPDGNERAPEAYGGYMLAAYADYLGTYVAWRHSFSRDGTLYRSIYEIDWDEELRRLRFLEVQKFRGAGAKEVSTSHAGGIYISPHTGLIQFLTTYQGALRLVTLSRFRMGDNKLSGLILTQSDRDRYFQPAASPIFLEKLVGRRTGAELERLIGPVTREDPTFPAAARELERVARDAAFVAGSAE